MKTWIIVCVLLIVLGVVALIYKGFSFTTEETVAQIGPLKATSEVANDVAISEVLGIVEIVAGIAVVALGADKNSTAKSSLLHVVGNKKEGIESRFFIAPSAEFTVRGVSCQALANAFMGSVHGVLALLPGCRGDFAVFLTNCNASTTRSTR